MRAAGYPDIDFNYPDIEFHELSGSFSDRIGSGFHHYTMFKNIMGIRILTLIRPGFLVYLKTGGVESALSAFLASTSSFFTQIN